MTKHFFLYCHDFHPSIIAELRPLTYIFIIIYYRTTEKKTNKSWAQTMEHHVFGKSGKHVLNISFRFFALPLNLCTRVPGGYKIKLCDAHFFLSILCKYMLNHCWFLFVSLWCFSLIKFAVVFCLRWNDLLIGIEIQPTNSSKSQFNYVRIYLFSHRRNAFVGLNAQVPVHLSGYGRKQYQISFELWTRIGQVVYPFKNCGLRSSGCEG